MPDCNHHLDGDRFQEAIDYELHASFDYSSEVHRIGRRSAHGRGRGRG